MATATQPNYVPTAIQATMATEDGRQLSIYIQRELQKIAASFGSQTWLQLVPISAAPPRPKTGMIVYADGTHWNPGSGAGIYIYNGATWVP